MHTLEEIKNYIEERTDETIVLFDNYETAFIGLTYDYPLRAIYDYNKMIDYLTQHDNMTIEEAIEWIDYNTVRALPYTENAPIIIETI